MKKSVRITILVVSVLFVSLFIAFSSVSESGKMSDEETRINLPEPRYKSQFSVEEAILNRRSIRNYSDNPLKLGEVSQILWALQGITDTEENLRTTPSAGALYPLEIYIVVGKVSSLSEGIYKYYPLTNEILKIKEGDFRRELSLAALGQSCVREGVMDIVIAGVYSRTTKKYGKRGVRYVFMEAGHAAQNVYLQVEALGLSTVVVGAFHDEKVRKVVGLSKKETPLYILPVGRN